MTEIRRLATPWCPDDEHWEERLGSAQRRGLEP